MFISSRIIYATFFYIFVISIIILKQPDQFFDENGNILSFGTRDNQSIFSLNYLSCILAIVSYYIFAVIDFIFD